MIARGGRRAAAAILLALGAADVALVLAPRAWARPLLHEGGPVESASALAYLLAAALLAGTVRLPGARRHGLRSASAMLLLLAGLRELDFHDRFTSQGITRLRFYTSAETALPEKLAAVAVALGVAAAALYVARAGWRALRTRTALPPPVLVAAALAPVAWATDRLVRLTVYDRGLDADAALAFALFVLEETSELAVPLLLLAAVLQTWPRSGERGPDEAATPR